jgi:two-component system sensor histidine kinase YesM
MKLSMHQRFFINNFLKNLLLFLLPVLLIGPYCIYQLNQESRNALKSSNYNMLHQIDETTNSLLSELNHIYYYIRSNPSIKTGLKSAYGENVLSPGSLTNIHDICSFLRYYMYSNEYIQNIYVLYYNDNNRILVPELGMVPADTYQDAAWIASTKDSENDIWVDSDLVLKDQYSAPVPVLRFYRKLYSTIDPSNQVGVIAVEYNENAILRYIDSLTFDNSQAIALIDRQKKILFKSGETDIFPFIGNDAGPAQGEFRYYGATAGNEPYLVSEIHSNYLDLLDYISVVPTKYVLQPAGKFERILGWLILAAVLLAVIAAAFRARKDFGRLEQILNLLSKPDTAVENETQAQGKILDPYHYITYNIINLFIRQNYLQVQTSEQKYRLQVLEQEALQQQINPHFLHNTLNTIYWEAIALTKGPNDCSGMIEKLSSIMRYSLSNPNEEVTIEEELGYLKNYVYIQSRRFKDKFTVEYLTDRNALKYPIRKIILQPILENSISHGIKEKTGKGIIRIRINLRDTGIYISIADNGIGIGRNRLRELKKMMNSNEEYSSHVGLMNSNRRLILAYGQAAELHISSHEKIGTCVYFRIPLNAEREAQK